MTSMDNDPKNPGNSLPSSPPSALGQSDTELVLKGESFGASPTLEVRALFVVESRWGKVGHSSPADILNLNVVYEFQVNPHNGRVIKFLGAFDTGPISPIAAEDVNVMTANIVSFFERHLGINKKDIEVFGERLDYDGPKYPRIVVEADILNAALATYYDSPRPETKLFFAKPLAETSERDGATHEIRVAWDGFWLL